jgi:hypothetical protein
MAKKQAGGMMRLKLRRQVYKETSSGRKDKWGEHYKLCLEIKTLACKKEIDR